MNVGRIRSFTKSQIEEVIKNKKKSTFVNVAKKLLMNVEDVKFIWKDHQKKLKFEAPQREKQQNQSQENSSFNRNFGEVDLRKNHENNDLSEENGYFEGEEEEEREYSVDNSNFDDDLDDTSQINYEDDEAYNLIDQESQIQNTFQPTPALVYYNKTLEFIEYVRFLENEYSNAQVS